MDIAARTDDRTTPNPDDECHHDVLAVVFLAQHLRDVRSNNWHSNIFRT